MKGETSHSASRRAPSRRLLHGVAVVALFTALTALLAYPLSLDPGRLGFDLGADTRLFVWTLAWDTHAIMQQPLSLFDANIFYPEGLTLAYSEHQLGSALLASPWLAAGGNPLLAMNLVLLFSCIGAGAGTYYLARRLGTGPLGAVAAGIIFAF
ncbi:MAG: hypothetical protein ACE5JI_16225, partial [Acidobacteriota bacterium]